LTERWCIPPEHNAAFVAAMEDVLTVYARPPDPLRPLICFDEGGKELHSDRQPPQPMDQGHPARVDYEYVRHGSANLFLATAPHLGWRQVTTTERRTSIDFAVAMRDLIDGPFAEADCLVLVLDNLNTHRPSAFYEAFAPTEARRLLDKIEWHYTPKHGSWLNIAEIELSVLARQCLGRRLPDAATLGAEVTAWAARRNATQTGVRWHFTVDEARVRLHHLYPIPQFDI
jgi:hypothetical protein